MLEKIIDAFASLRKDFQEEYEADSGENFDTTANWEDNPSFYAGLDRGIELALEKVKELVWMT